MANANGMILRLHHRIDAYSLENLTRIYRQDVVAVTGAIPHVPQYLELDP
jgi:hypothetical protein